MTTVEKLMGSVILGAVLVGGGYYGMKMLKQETDAEKSAHAATCQMAFRVVKKELDHNMISNTPPRSYELHWLATLTEHCDDVTPEVELPAKMVKMD